MKSWVHESIFYHIYPLGFCEAPISNDSEIQIVNRIEKIKQWIPHMKSLGINAIYLGPVFESNTHGYDTTDYYKIDKRLGSNEDFKALCKSLHENGIRIVLDGVFNHVGRNFFAFKDIIKNDQNSKYRNWFSNINFNLKSPYKDNFSYDTWEGHYELVKLNLKNPEVKEHLFKAVSYWIETFNIDGLRLDAANCLDINFLKELSVYCKNKKEDFWLMGEVIHGDYNIWANENMLDSITNYECYKGIYSSLNDKNYFEINYSLNRQFGEHGIYKNLNLYNFIDNHDVTRISSILNNPNHIYLAYTMLFTMPGVPSLYYGSEYGIKGKKCGNSDLALRPSLDEIKNQTLNEKLFDLITQLSKIRTFSSSLKFGIYKEVVIKNEQIVFARIYNKETILVVLNLSDNQIASFKFNIPNYGTYLLDLLDNNKNYTLVNGTITLNLEPYCKKILKVL
ncbi:alpha-amylase family glycosyl hydrolase [Clostridium drakei]|uniref:Alpha-amylase n=1 Tax=Clostridium drakei TaxID=332101 RepID=A0A2U8DT23_9CLOT|nr:alpha-amylase family glycosyl hydrolase [Clostridium drakei]AWI05252.1 alpha-amylase [Clostridium drakei]